MSQIKAPGNPYDVRKRAEHALVTGKIAARSSENHRETDNKEQKKIRADEHKRYGDRQIEQREQNQPFKDLAGGKRLILKQNIRSL